MMKRLRNEGIVNDADRISQLPEALLLHVLSLLPIKDVVATSALSKQWRSLWKMVHQLKFDYDHNQRKIFPEIVRKVLFSNKAHVLDSLHLHFNSHHCDAMDIGMWIGAAYARHVRELVLYVVKTKNLRQLIKFPISLYKCETLEILKLKCWVLVDVPSQVCLKSLKTLNLYHVYYKDDASVLNLLSGCPNLKNLLVCRLQSDVKIFTIAVPSLQRLTVYGNRDAEEVDHYVVNAPSLKYLNIARSKTLKFCLIENAPMLVEAIIATVSKIIDEKLLVALTSVKRLSLSWSPLEIRFPTGSIFNQLVYLKLHTHKDEWWNLLLFMLDSSPELKVLKIIGLLCDKDCVAACEKWNQQKYVSERLSPHLETFVWNGYKEQLGEEKEVAKYILSNANRLKRATFSIKGLNSDERLEMLAELESVVRASNSPCQIILFA